MKSDFNILELIIGYHVSNGCNHEVFWVWNYENIKNAHDCAKYYSRRIYGVLSDIKIKHIMCFLNEGSGSPNMIKDKCVWWLKNNGYLKI